MLDLSSHQSPAPKCYFSHSLLPNYINPLHPPNKKKPFSAFKSQPFSHTLDLILPEELYEIVRQQLEGEVGILRYARVYMKLEEILSGEFFNEYIKRGNIMMLSEGRPKVDNVFSLFEGILRIELDRPTYERCGLVGKPIEDGGKKHKKSRYVIEYNLREPSMLHGKKGFERLKRACVNVLNNSLTWLFHDFQPPQEGEKAPIMPHHPFLYNTQPISTLLSDLLVPNLPPFPKLYGSDQSLELLEYLHLISLDSPRIRANDKIDPYLSRYEVPSFTSDEDNVSQIRTWRRVRWHGFIPPRFASDIYIIVRKELEEMKEEEGGWFAMTGKAFGGYRGCYTAMQFKGRDTLVWECEQ